MKKITVKYRQPDKRKWDTLENVIAVNIFGGARYLLTADNIMVWISIDAELEHHYVPQEGETLKGEYEIKYRRKGDYFTKKMKKIIGDGFENGARFFLTSDDKIHWMSVHTEIEMEPKRQELTTKTMSSEIGQPIQRA